MPWPDFTELSFGYSFLREFEREYVPGGQFPKAPDFISQQAEATKGYDVEIALSDSTPVFLQLKRSYVLTGTNAKEYQEGYFSTPIAYRMHLHKKNGYQQHRALRMAENAGDKVFYVTSQIKTPEELTTHALAGTIVASATAAFTPLEINLPDLTEAHHVSFKASDDFGWIFSEKGKRFERRAVSFSDALLSLPIQSRSAKENREYLQDFVGRFLPRTPKKSKLRSVIDQFKDPVEQASVLAFFYLDAQLTFVAPKGAVDDS